MLSIEIPREDSVLVKVQGPGRVDVHDVHGGGGRRQESAVEMCLAMSSVVLYRDRNWDCSFGRQTSVVSKQTVVPCSRGEVNVNTSKIGMSHFASRMYGSECNDATMLLKRVS